MLDASSKLDEMDKVILEISEDKKRIIIYNMSDLTTQNEDGKIYISALKGDISPLKKEIYKAVGLDNEAFTTPSLNNTRQLGLLRNVKESLLKAKLDVESDLSVDLIAVSIYDAYRSILEILGEVDQIDISKEIFKRFCVGK